MRVRISYCRPCGYRSRADALADELRARFSADVEVVEGKLGQFDVVVDGVLVVSHGDTLISHFRRPPKLAAIVGAIEARLATREGDHCEVPSRV